MPFHCLQVTEYDMVEALQTNISMGDLWLEGMATVSDDHLPTRPARAVCADHSGPPPG